MDVAIVAEPDVVAAGKLQDLERLGLGHGSDQAALLHDICVPRQEIGEAAAGGCLVAGLTSRLLAACAGPTSGGQGKVEGQLHGRRLREVVVEARSGASPA
jgi:hypothetical protein